MINLNPTGVQPQYPAADELAAHVRHLHDAARPFAGRGLLNIAGFGEIPDPKQSLTPVVRHFQIGDWAEMVDAVDRLGSEPHRNVYAALSVFRPDLKPGSKGGTADVVAVLGLVADFDDADAVNYATRLPIEAAYVLETSPGRFQCGIIFERPLPAPEARELAQQLRVAAQCDFGTADISHVWRLPGTRNWPNAAKVAGGRPAEPQPVRTVRAWTGSGTNVDVLRRREAPVAKSAPASTEKSSKPWTREPRPQYAGPEDDADLIAKMLAHVGAAAAFGGKATARQLWEADADALAAAYPDAGGAGDFDESRADLALAATLAFWAGGNCDRVERLMWQSALKRPKWERPDYLRRTISRACADLQSWPGKGQPQAMNAAGPSAASHDADLPTVASEADLADKFALGFGDRLRYVAAWGQWLHYDGRLWRRDDTLATVDLVRAVCQRAAGSAVRPSDHVRLGGAGTVAGVERLARADRRHAATTDLWDADPWLLNTPGGMVDLRTGDLQPHRPDAYVTKSAAVGPGGGCPNWLRFLRRATGGDEALMSFLQRVAGYCLTGSTRDHALFFLYGTGSNGKSIFINALAEILGTYSAVAAMETFMAPFGDRHPTDLAGLRGARLVVAQETDQGRRWNEARIKTVTGGDRIAARFMRGDFFEYVPEFKLVISGNHKPVLRNVDAAVRRRLHIVPFAVTVPPDERDPALPEKLKLEWPGILAWAVQGCIDWQRVGLSPPAAVVDATGDYLEAQDAFGAWLIDRVERRAGSFESSAALFGNWRIWAETAQEFVGAEKAFAERLQARGFVKTRRHGGTRGFADVALRLPPADPV